MNSDILTSLKQASTWSIGLGILMVIAGIVAISLPLATGVLTTIWIGSILTIIALAKFFYAWQSRDEGGFLPKLLVALLYLVAGIVLLVNPLQGVITLTLVLGTFLILEGGAELVLAFQMRPVASNWGWVLGDGVITLIFGLLIWLQWPISATWVIGLLLGISIISSGLSRIMLSIALRSALSS